MVNATAQIEQNPSETLKSSLDLEKGTFSLAYIPSGVWEEVKNSDYEWKYIISRLMKPRKVTHTLEEYYKETKTAQAILKHKGGFVGGRFSGITRKSSELICRTLLTLDIDSCRTPQGGMLSITEIEYELGTMGIEYVLYTTHSSTKDDPKLRIVSPLSREVSPDEYKYIVKSFIAKYGSKLGEIDSASSVPSQLMFLPVDVADGHFYSKHQEGTLFDVEEYLHDFKGGYQISTPQEINLRHSSKYQELREINYEVITFADLDLGHRAASRDDIEAALQLLDPNMKNQEWVTVGMALHHWNEVEGLDLWDEWSQGGHTYKEGECYRRWDSFSGLDKEHIVTVGTLFHKARKAATTRLRKVIDDIVEEINKATKDDIYGVIMGKIRAAKIEGQSQLDSLAGAIHVRLKELDSSAPTRSSILKDLRPIKKAIKAGVENAPEWCKPWVYSVQEHRYFNINTGENVGSQGFNNFNRVYLPQPEKGGAKPNPEIYAMDNGFIEKVSHRQYDPTQPTPFFTTNGLRYLNTFDPSSIPKPAERINLAEARDTIHRFEAHIETLFINDSKGGLFFKYWFAHQVQNTGELLGWLPLIQSIQGLGKSMLETLLRSILGKDNVGVVTPKSLKENFNNWAYGVAVNMLSEIKISGHNRYEITDALKPNITDEHIEIIAKGKDPINVVNRCNYVAFTNHKDAVPVAVDDRRWFIHYVPFRTIEEFVTAANTNLKQRGVKITDPTPHAYYSNLRNVVSSPDDAFQGGNAHYIHKYLKELEIPEWFKQQTTAPNTQSKEMLSRTEEDKRLGDHAEIHDVLERGGLGFNNEVVSVKHLRAELDKLASEGLCEVDGSMLQGRRSGATLQKLGFGKLGKISWKNPETTEFEVVNAWSRSPMSKENFKLMLDATFEGAF